MHDLIESVFVSSFSNGKPNLLSDAAIVPHHSNHIAFTTDSFVVDPLFFPGGDIGKLSVCGTVNDLAVSGAVPEFLSCGFIIEEGFDIGDLVKIAHSMAETAKKAGVRIITGDTKVVPKGKCDKIFISTSGIGKITTPHVFIGTGQLVTAGSLIMVNGGIAEHGMAILGQREGMSFDSKIRSDCAPLNDLIQQILKLNVEIQFMRDATRGGVATVLCELARITNLGIEIIENQIPIKESVSAVCEILGFDPLYVANEGKFICVVKLEHASRVIHHMRKHPLGREAMIIGEIVNDHPGTVILETAIGGRRIIEPLSGEQLPRIC